jgi:amino acid transporter
MSTTGSVGGLLVWASQCLAFIQYRKWLHIHRSKLLGRYLKYNRWQTEGNENRYDSTLSFLQPAVAYFGLIGCLLIVLIFSSANWWSTDVTVKKVAIAYAGPVMLLSLWIVLKAVRRHQVVKLDRDWNTLRVVIDKLEHRIAEGDNTLKDTKNMTIGQMRDFHLC